MTTKEADYGRIFESKTDSEMVSRLMEYLYLDDVDTSDIEEIERIREVLFHNKAKTWLHIITTEMIINSIVVSDLDKHQDNYQKYLKILSKYSLVLNELSMLYLDDMIDEIIRISSTDVIVDVIEALEGETRIAVIRRLSGMSYWRRAIPKLELYDTFS